ncbi:unnamed protein product [Pleuronectes platessa]|uniref:Uncharacterized protein n=1 Tax=Pleuronectes platessa TaxID=8262 RepID=A0A9N7U0Z5_PLEPL|nr:unnamed protein product [Pleuronectes platessa]
MSVYGVRKGNQSRGAVRTTVAIGAYFVSTELNQLGAESTQLLSTCGIQMWLLGWMRDSRVGRMLEGNVDKREGGCPMFFQHSLQYVLALAVILWSRLLEAVVVSEALSIAGLHTPHSVVGETSTISQ